MAVSYIDLEEIASGKRFKYYVDNPYLVGENLTALFDFKNQKGKLKDLVIQGSDSPEWVYAGSEDDVLYLEGGNDIGVGSIGSDTIYGGDGIDYLFGDTDYAIQSGYVAPDDFLSGDDGDDVLFGDSKYLLGGATGGNDTLDGGTGNDTLWGDGALDASSFGGADQFVFEAGDGDDVIMDFRSSDGNGTGDSIVFVGDPGTINVQPDGENTIITYGLDGSDSITLIGFTETGYFEFA